MADQLIDLAIYARGLSVGQSFTGLVCPFCGGGNSKDRSLSVTRIEIGILYNCFRASCKRAGMQITTDAPQVSFTENKLNVKSPQRSRVYTGQLVDLPDEVRAYLNTKYQLTNGHIQRGRVQWAPDFDTPEWHGRVWFPTFTADGSTSGGIARSIDGAKPKTLTYLRDGELMLSWLTNAKGPNVCVLCEDAISGLRLSKMVTALPLLGTSLSIEKAKAIASRRFDAVYLCLDPDAIAVSIDAIVQFQSILPLQVVMPPNDPKDLTEAELLEFLMENKII